MMNPNADLIRGGYDAFGQGDIAAVLPHARSGSRLARAGTQPAFWAITKATMTSSASSCGRMGPSGRTFKIDIDAVLAEGERVVVLCTV